MLKRVLHFLLGEYGLYRIFACDLTRIQEFENPAGTRVVFHEFDAEQLAAHDGNALGTTAWYGGPDTFCFAASEQENVLAIQWFWQRQRLERPLQALVPELAVWSTHIEVLPDARGRGLSKYLKRYSLLQLKALGFRSVISRVWHNNHPSLRMNAALGAEQIGWLVEINPLRRPKPWTFHWQNAVSRRQ